VRFADLMYGATNLVRTALHQGGRFVERKRSARETFDEGSEIVEFGLVLVPMLALVFLVINVGWMIFAKASLLEAVRSGVRFGVTGQVTTGQAGVTSSIRQVVQQNSSGFISAANAASKISIQYFAPATLSPVAGVSRCAGGNIVQVSATGVAIAPLAAVLISPAPLTLSAASSDIMESSPNNITPSCL
jgi:Flp pilus assembly protein TadG